MARVSFIFLLLAGLFVALTPTASAFGGQGYGPWFPAPGSNSSSAAYNVVNDPSSSAKVAEISDFSCYFNKSGVPLTERQRVIMRDYINIATAMFAGTGSRFNDSGGDGGPGSGVLGGMADQAQVYTENPGGGKGIAPVNVMGAYLRIQQRILREQGLVWDGKFDETQTLKDWWEQNKRSASGMPGSGNLLDGGTDSGGASRELDYSPAPDAALAAAVNVEAKNPLQLTNPSGKEGDTAGVSPGCALDPLAQHDPGGIERLIADPPRWFEDVLFWLAGSPIREVYNWLQPMAFVYTFWSPHVERGDTLFNTTDKIETNSCRNNLGNANTAAQDSCNGTTPLGFSKTKLADKSSTPWYMGIAFFLQWLLSGTYFVIMFAAALVYMVRGSASASFNVMHIIPRIIVSVIITMFGPWLIGIGITLSNSFVQAMFNYDDAASIGAINYILSAGPSLIQGSEFLGRILQIILGASAAFFYAFFLIGAVIRNFALILLIALLPLGAFCFIVPAWRQKFGLFMRTAIAVIFLPAIMAFILKIGISINPLVQAAESGSTQYAVGGVGVIGMILLLVTLWMMARSAKIAKAYVTGGGQSALLASGMGAAAGRLQQAGEGRGGVSGATLRALGMGAGGASAAMHAGNEGTAALVPQHKGLLASGGGGGQSALRRGMNQASADKGGGMPGDNLQNKMDAAIKRHRRDRGITSISEEQAFANDQRYRTKEMEHINRLRRDNGGNPLANEDEIRAQFKSDYQAATGHDTRHGNTWRHHGNVPEDARKSITNTIRNAIKNAGGPRDGGSPPVGGGSAGAASQETKSPV
jgi:hypothetical protein